MEQTYISIERAVKPIYIDYVQVLVEQVELNKGATCFVVLYDEQKQPQDRIRLFIGGADYDRWIEDDDIIDVVLEKLNVKRKVIPPTPVPSNDEEKINVEEENMDTQVDEQE